MSEFGQGGREKDGRKSSPSSVNLKGVNALDEWGR